MGAFELRGQCDPDVYDDGQEFGAWPWQHFLAILSFTWPLVELPVLLLMAQGLVRLRPVLWARQFSQKDTTPNGS